MEFNHNDPFDNDLIEIFDLDSFMNSAEERITISVKDYKDLLVTKGKVEIVEKVLSNLGYLKPDIEIATRF